MISFSDYHCAHHNLVTDDSFKAASEFNKFFVSFASNLKEPVINSDFNKLKDFCSYSKVPKDVHFDIPANSHDKVLKYLSHIDVSKATGCDQIGPCLLKTAAPYIVDSITYICNQSILDGVFS